MSWLLLSRYYSTSFGQEFVFVEGLSSELQLVQVLALEVSSFETMTSHPRSQTWFNLLDKVIGARS